MKNETNNFSIGIYTDYQPGRQKIHYVGVRVGVPVREGRFMTRAWVSDAQSDRTLNERLKNIVMHERGRDSMWQIPLKNRPAPVSRWSPFLRQIVGHAITIESCHAVCLLSAPKKV